MAEPETIQRGRLREWIINIHLYGGLLCSSYLVIYGISSLLFNHAPEFAEPDAEVTHWTEPLQAPALDDDMETAAAVRDALGLFGWPLPWATYRDDQGELHFELARPGKQYTLHVASSESLVRVEERPRGVWLSIRSLHGLAEEVPGSRYLRIWGMYTEITNWVVLFSIFSGVYLWLFRRKERKIGWKLLLGAGGVSLLLFLYAVLIG